MTINYPAAAELIAKYLMRQQGSAVVEQQSRFITAMFFTAFGTIAPDFFRKHLFGNDLKPLFFKKLRFTGQREQAPVSVRELLIQLIDHKFDQGSADPLPVK